MVHLCAQSISASLVVANGPPRSDLHHLWSRHRAKVFLPTRWRHDHPRRLCCGASSRHLECRPSGRDPAGRPGETMPTTICVGRRTLSVRPRCSSWTNQLCQAVSHVAQRRRCPASHATTGDSVRVSVGPSCRSPCGFIRMGSARRHSRLVCWVNLWLCPSLVVQLTIMLLFDAS